MLQYLVRLRPTDRDQLFTLVTTGRAAATKQLRARLRLNAEIKAGARRWTAGDIAEALETSEATGPWGRQAWVEQGLEAALVRTRPTGRPSRQRDGTRGPAYGGGLERPSRKPRAVAPAVMGYAAGGPEPR
jgi:hypothetical protein